MGRAKRGFDGTKEFDERAFGEKVRTVRKQTLKITAKNFSKELGVSVGYVRQLECGCKTPSLELFIEICKRLSVSPSYLLAESVDPSLAKDTQNDNMVLAMKIAALSADERKMLENVITAMEGNEEKTETALVH